MLKLIYTGLLAFIYTVMVFLFFFSLPKKDAPRRPRWRSPTPTARARRTAPRMARGQTAWPASREEARSVGSSAARLWLRIARAGSGARRRGRRHNRQRRRACRDGVDGAWRGRDDVGDDARPRQAALLASDSAEVARDGGWRQRRGARRGSGAAAVGGRWLDPSAAAGGRRGGHDDDGAAAARTLSRCSRSPIRHPRPISPAGSSGCCRHLIGDEPPAEQGASLAGGGLVAQGRQCMDVELAGRRLVLA